MPTEAEIRRRKKQDATRKRVAIWLERNGPEDKALRRIMRKHKLTARIDALRMLLPAADAQQEETETR